MPAARTKLVVTSCICCLLQQLVVAVTQAHPELRNLYMGGSEVLMQAQMRQAVSLLRQQQAAGAAQASRQAFDMVQQVRSVPLLHAQAAALHGRCCAVQSLLASQPAAKGEQPYTWFSISTSSVVAACSRCQPGSAVVVTV